MIHHDPVPDRTAVSKNDADCHLKTPFAQQKFTDIRTQCQLVNDEEIPSLEEILRFFSEEKIKFFVELKDHPSEQTLALLKDYAAKITVLSFEEQYLKRVYKYTKSGKYIPLILLADTFQDVPDYVDGLGTQDFTFRQRQELAYKRKLTNVWTVNDFKSMKEHFLEGTGYVTTNEVEDCLRALEQAKRSRPLDGLKREKY